MRKILMSLALVATALFGAGSVVSANPTVSGANPAMSAGPATRTLDGDAVSTLPSFPIPTSKVFQYTYRSDSGRFYNLADLPEAGAEAYGITIAHKMLLGADIEEGAPLRDVFFVFNDGAFAPVTLNKDLAAEDRGRFQPAYPLTAFTATLSPQSYFAGDTTYGFAVAAIGGLLFTDSLPEPDQDGNRIPIVNCQDAAKMRSALCKNFVRYFPIRRNAANDIIVPKKKKDVPPVILAFGLTDEGEGVILSQFEYLVTDSTWRIQILYYLSSCKTEFIIGHFGVNDNASVDGEDKNFFVIPAVVKNGGNPRDFIAFGKGKDKIGIGTGHLPCWSVITNIDSVGSKGIPVNGPHHAKIGRIISVVPPVDSASLTLEGFKSYPNRLEGWGILDPRKSSRASFQNIRSILILSSDQTPEQNAIDPPVFIHKASRYRPGAKVSTSTTTDAYTVLFDTMPFHFDKLDSVPLTKGRLKQNTNYYLYIYMGDTNAYTEKSYFYQPQPTAVFGPHKTDYVGAVRSFTMSKVLQDSVELTMDVDNPSTYTVLVGSMNVNPIGYNDMVGMMNNPNISVPAFLPPGIHKTTLHLPKGVGGYLHCYAAKIMEKDTFYTDSPLTQTVYRPTDSLPLFFDFKASDVLTTEWPAGVAPTLPPGWYHGTYAKADGTVETQPQVYFSTKIDVSNNPHLHITAPEAGYKAYLLTPVFISNHSKVRASFEVEYHHNGLAYDPIIGKDSVFVEYQLNNDPTWRTALSTGTIPPPSGGGEREIDATFECQTGDMVRIRYGVRLGKEGITHGLLSLGLEEDNACKTPVNLVSVSDHNTDEVVEVSWDDPNDDPNVSYMVYYQPANTDFYDQWERTYTRKKSVVLSYLNPNTTYRVRVQAVCSEELSSSLSHFVLSSTQYGLPFIDKLNVVYDVPGRPNSQIMETPRDRGFTTRVGIIGDIMDLSQDSDLTWSEANSITSLRNQCIRGMGVGEHVEHGALISPIVYTESDIHLSFTLSSFKLDSVVNSVRYLSYGAVPSNAECKLHVAVSNAGHFREHDIVHTFTGNELNLVDSTFHISVRKSGRMQVGFFFENPAIRREGKFYIEVDSVSMTSDQSVKYELSLGFTPKNGGEVNGAGSYRQGQEVTISAKPNKNFSFSAWKDGETEVSQSINYTFIMPGHPVYYTAVFENRPDAEYELRLTAEPVEGGITMGAGYYKADAAPVISTRPNRGYEFVAWVNALNEKDTISLYTSHPITMPATNVHYIAKFIKTASLEDNLPLRTGFNLSTENGVLTIKNLCGTKVNHVDVFGVNGTRLHRFSPHSSDNLNLPIDAAHALLFVRLHTEKGTVVYKVYMR